MEENTKYLIHARIVANGIVERSDVVGAVFGQTEGLLGDELDLRDLQQASKVGRIDVEIDAENGQSFGSITIATNLDKAETAILGASLETIDRIGPCHADIEVTEIEDIRTAKRREIVDRAKELLATAFDETSVSSTELIEDVRESVRVGDLTEYEGLPAGPRVADSDAIIVVEGRADVRRLLEYGIKNTIAVEGTDIPPAIAELTTNRTTTVFVDGDRGGELILRELLQVADVDFVAFAPTDRSVEDLSRNDVLTMLRQKVSADRLDDGQNVRETMAGFAASEPPMTPDADNEATADTEVEVVPTSSPAASPSPPTDTTQTAPTNAARQTQSASATGVEVPDSPDSTDTATPEAPIQDEPLPDQPSDEASDGAADEATDESDDSNISSESSADGEADSGETEPGETEPDEPDSGETPATLRSHVSEIIHDESGMARVLTETYETVSETDSDELSAAIEAAEAPFSVVVDGELSQRVLDVAAQHGVDHIVARSTGEFVKKPVGTRVLTAEELEPQVSEIEH